MFEKQLKEDLKKLFDFDKVSFDFPGDAREQECLFINVEKPVMLIKNGRQFARVNGSILVFAGNEKLPYGYFSKQIAALPDISRKFFFFDIEENTRLYRDVSQRTLSFIYFYNSQYDPEQGSMEAITITEQ